MQEQAGVPRNGLQRFIDAQDSIYYSALGELRSGLKVSHWMWFIFPQLASLGQSDKSRFYGLRDLEETKAYWQHPLLGARLEESTLAFLSTSRSVDQVFPWPDNRKFYSCMTLFSLVSERESVFRQTLSLHFGGMSDEKTIKYIDSITVTVHNENMRRGNHL